MFESIAPRPNDAIMAVMEKCKADTRPEKIDLGVGVYKDATGNTTILKSVKLAEEMWGREETTKTYVGTGWLWCSKAWRRTFESCGP